MADEVVLVAADEEVALRFRISLDLDAPRLRDLSREIAEVGLGESENDQRLERNDREKHVDVDVGDHGLRVDRGILREVLGAEQSFLFPSHENKQQGALKFFGRFFEIGANVE